MQDLRTTFFFYQNVCSEDITNSYAFNKLMWKVTFEKKVLYLHIVEYNIFGCEFRPY